MQVRDWARSIYWMYAVMLDPDRGITAEQVMNGLKIRGIGTRPFFRGLHDQPALPALNRGRYPHTDAAYRYGFYLPSGLTLTEDTIRQVAAALRDELHQAKESEP